MVNLDEALISIGGFGREQIKYCVIICFVRLSTALCFLSYAFISIPVPFTCAKKDNMTMNSACHESCEDYEFDRTMGQTLVSEWSLVCGE